MTDWWAAEALETQVRLSRWYHTHITTGGGVAGELKLGKGISRREVDAINIRILAEGETFVWAPGLTDLLLVAQEGLRDWAPTPQALPARAGFVRLAAGLPIPDYDEETAARAAADLPGRVSILRPRTLEAVGWLATGNGVYVTSFASGVRLGGEHDGEATRSDILPLGCIGWEWNDPYTVLAQQCLATVAPDDTVGRQSGAQDLTAMRTFGAVLAFLEQELVVSPSRTVDRSTRRRVAQAGWTREPRLRVVELRTPVYTTGHAASGLTVDWSHRWLVRGHWANQWYPRHGSHKTIWVRPYVKGPPDKPLKTPPATVFAVVR